MQRGIRQPQVRPDALSFLRICSETYGLEFQIMQDSKDPGIMERDKGKLAIRNLEFNVIVTDL